MTHSFINSLLGDTIALGGRDDIPSGFMYLAGPGTVKWADGKALHPDQIDTIEFRNKPAKVIKRLATQVDPNSWMSFGKLVTVPGHTRHALYLKTETGTVIRYEDFIDHDGNSLDKTGNL